MIFVKNQQKKKGRKNNMAKFNIYHRRDGRWEGRISRGKKSNGRRCFQYIFAKTKKQVIEKMENIYQKEKNSTSSSKTFREIYDEWFCCIKYNIKESTASNYRMKAEKHILPNFGKQAMGDIVQNDIYSLIEEKKREGLSLRYVSDIIVLIKSIFKFAVRKYHIFNPMDGIILPKKKSSDIKILDDEEQKKLQMYVSDNPSNTTLGIDISMFTGIRIGELCALQWKDIDLKKRILTVSKTIQRIQSPTEEARTKLIVTEPKSESSKRCIPIPECLMPMLKRFKSYDNDYVLSGNEKPTEPRTMQYRFCKILKNVNLPSVHFHALRHIFASNCIKLGFDAKALSELLGHSSVEITLNKYVHSSFDQKRKYMKRLSLNF